MERQALKGMADCGGLVNTGIALVEDMLEIALKSMEINCQEFIY